jgi:hypothetical protein
MVMREGRLCFNVLARREHGRDIVSEHFHIGDEERDEERSESRNLDQDHEMERGFKKRSGMVTGVLLGGMCIDWFMLCVQSILSEYQ